jgi:hypothetical protein
MNCTQCGQEVLAGAVVCPNCNAAVATPGAAQPMPGYAPPPAPQVGAATVAFDMNRLSQTDRIAGVATLALLISLFLPWFSVSALGFSVSASGLSSHGYLYLVMLLAIAEIGYLVLRALDVFKLPPTLPLGHDQVLLVVNAINLVLVLIAFLLMPGGGVAGVGWAFGAFVGLVAAIVAVVPLALPAIKARQGKS